MAFKVNYRHELIDGFTGFVNVKGARLWDGAQHVAQIPPLDD